ncbi:MAG: hypothetical protein SFX73_09905 [Kofleriaceae bacterium]|nr:hypothetical protein [Kofleriaceae bacterium]
MQIGVGSDPEQAVGIPSDQGREVGRRLAGDARNLGGFVVQPVEIQARLGEGLEEALGAP